LVFRVSVEEGLNLELEHPAAQRTAEGSSAPKVEFPESFSEETHEKFHNFQQQITHL